MIRLLGYIALVASCRLPAKPIVISTPPTTAVALEPVMSVEQAKAIASRFSWDTAPALAETNADGTPAVYYASIYFHNRAQLAILPELAIRHSALPLFPSEWRTWRGVGRLAPTRTVGQGVRFAIIPGRIFNLLRKAKSPVIDAIVVRNVPVAAKLPNGALSYDAIARARWYGTQTSTRSADFIPSIATVRALAAEAAEAARDIGHDIARKLGEIDRDGVLGIGEQGAVTLALELQTFATDEAFAPPIWKSKGLSLSDPPGRMVRMWGTRFGKPIALTGVRVSVMSSADLGVITLFDGSTNADGIVTIRMAKNRPIDAVCIELSNDAADVTDFLAPIELCGFNDYLDGTGIGTIKRDTKAILRLQDPYINVLAQATDGRDFLREVVGYAPHRATILVGDLANAIASFGKGTGTTACLGFPDPHTDVLAIALGSVVSALGLPAEIVPVFLVDMWIPEKGDSIRSRVSATHEYGHYAMCSMMFDHDPLAFAAGFFVAAIERIKDGSTPPPTSESAINLEAFADFFAAQVTGGVRYFDPQPSGTFTAKGSQMCSARSSDCMDHNWSYLPKLEFGNEVRRVATTLHDAFDGHFADANVWAPASEPGNADAWGQSAGLVVPAFHHGGDAHDENIALDGRAIKTFIDGVSSLDHKTFMHALATTMTKAGYSWCDVCRVFALHSGSPSASIVGACTSAPINTWIDPPRAGETCGARPSLQLECPAGQFLLDDGISASCVDACPQGWAADGNVCRPIIR